MRFPVDNYYKDWDNHAGYDFGDPTSYGFHDGKDINDNGGVDSDMGKPLYAISKGRVVGIHKHTGTGNFGNHFFIQIDGKWGTRYVHYAHCLELFIEENQEVEEGKLVAKVGNSGTTYAHCHFALKKKPSGMDDIANNKADLDDIWEDPIAFIEKWIKETPEPPKPPELTGTDVEVGYKSTFEGQVVEVNGKTYKSFLQNNILVWIEQMPQEPQTATTATYTTSQTPPTTTSTITIPVEVPPTVETPKPLKKSFFQTLIEWIKKYILRK